MYHQKTGYDSNGNSIYQMRCDGGMSLRDYFAAKETLSDCDNVTITALEACNSDVMPDFKNDPLAYLKWEAKARANLKFIRADAMIAARNS
jgi:hypothetical protein